MDLGRGRRDDDFVDFVQRHRARLLRSATLMCAGDAYAAEDVVQTTLTKLYLAWRRASRADDPLRYAHRVLVNSFLDDRKRAHRRHEASHEDAATLADRAHRAPLGPAGPADPADRIDDGEHAALVAALRELPPRQRAVVVLRHWLDYDVATTARVLGCAPGTVKSQNAKAIEHLRRSVPRPAQETTP